MRANFNQAQLLKQVGYDVPTSMWFEDINEDVRLCGSDFSKPFNWSEHDGCYSAPTLDDTINWLYNEHDIYIWVVPSDKFRTWEWFIRVGDSTEILTLSDTDNFITSREGAISKAIDKALTILKERT